MHRDKLNQAQAEPKEGNENEKEIKETIDETKSQVSSSDVGLSSDVSSEFSDDEPEYEETWRNILWQGLITYGPPYKKNDEDTPSFALITECSNYNCNLVSLHSFLNKQLDPNERDPDDLNYTPMHWCVKNCHLQALKMLHQAGANLNILNELGKSYMLIYVTVFLFKLT